MNICSCVADASRNPVGRRPFFVRIDGAKLLSVAAAAELPLHGRALASPWTWQTLRSPCQTLHQLTRASRNPKDARNSSSNSDHVQRCVGVTMRLNQRSFNENETLIHTVCTPISSQKSSFTCKLPETQREMAYTAFGAQSSVAEGSSWSTCHRRSACLQETVQSTRCRRGHLSLHISRRAPPGSATFGSHAKRPEEIVSFVDVDKRGVPKASVPDDMSGHWSQPSTVRSKLSRHDALEPSSSAFLANARAHARFWVFDSCPYRQWDSRPPLVPKVQPQWLLLTVHGALPLRAHGSPWTVHSAM